jgi:DNA-binding GntR family transcriptional regulator
VRDHYELYGLVYGFAARKALERSGSLLGEKLMQLAHDFSRARTPEEANQLAIGFHGAVVDGAASPRINVTLRAMSPLLPGTFYALVPKATKLQGPGFNAIARAFKREDGERAAEEYTKMMLRVAGEVVVLFRDRGLFV